MSTDCTATVCRRFLQVLRVMGWRGRTVGGAQAREMELSVLWCPALSDALGWPNPPDSATHFPTSLVSISSMA